MARDVAGWAFFAILCGAWFIPLACYIAPPPEVVCWKERRLAWVNLQPRTELTNVCEVRG